MLVSYFLVIFLSETVLVDVQADPIEILDKILRPIVDFKENIINGKLTVQNCLNDKKSFTNKKNKRSEFFTFLISYLRCFWQG